MASRIGAGSPEEAKIPCATVQQFHDEIAKLSDVLAPEEKEDTWQKFEKALLRFAAITRGGGYKFTDAYVRAVGAGWLGDKLVTCVLSDRGKLSGVATDLLNAMIPRLALNFAPLILHYLPPIIRIFSRSNKVYTRRSEKCLHNIVTHCQVPSMIGMIRLGVSDKAEGTRKATSGALEKIMVEWDRQTIGAKGIVELELGMRKMATERDPEVRKMGKRMWEAYSIKWPERVDDFTAPLTPTIRKYLDISGERKAVAKKEQSLAQTTVVRQAVTRADIPPAAPKPMPSNTLPKQRSLAPPPPALADATAPLVARVRVTSIHKPTAPPTVAEQVSYTPLEKPDPFAPLYPKAKLSRSVSAMPSGLNTFATRPNQMRSASVMPGHGQDLASLALHGQGGSGQTGPSRPRIPHSATVADLVGTPMVMGGPARPQRPVHVSSTTDLKDPITPMTRSAGPVRPAREAMAASYRGIGAVEADLAAKVLPMRKRPAPPVFPPAQLSTTPHHSPTRTNISDDSRRQGVEPGLDSAVRSEAESIERASGMGMLEEQAPRTEDTSTSPSSGIHPGQADVEATQAISQTAESFIALPGSVYDFERLGEDEAEREQCMQGTAMLRNRPDAPTGPMEINPLLAGVSVAQLEIMLAKARERERGQGQGQVAREEATGNRVAVENSSAEGSAIRATDDGGKKGKADVEPRAGEQDKGIIKPDGRRREAFKPTATVGAKQPGPTVPPPVPTDNQARKPPIPPMRNVSSKQAAKSTSLAASTTSSLSSSVARVRAPITTVKSEAPAGKPSATRAAKFSSTMAGPKLGKPTAARPAPPPAGPSSPRKARVKLKPALPPAPPRKAPTMKGIASDKPAAKATLAIKVGKATSGKPAPPAQERKPSAQVDTTVAMDLPGPEATVLSAQQLSVPEPATWTLAAMIPLPLSPDRPLQPAEDQHATARLAVAIPLPASPGMPSAIGRPDMKAYLPPSASSRDLVLEEHSGPHRPASAFSTFSAESRGSSSASTMPAPSRAARQVRQTSDDGEGEGSGGDREGVSFQMRPMPSDGDARDKTPLKRIENNRALERCIPFPIADAKRMEKGWGNSAPERSDRKEAGRRVCTSLEAAPMSTVARIHALYESRGFMPVESPVRSRAASLKVGVSWQTPRKGLAMLEVARGSGTPDLYSMRSV